MRRHYAGIGSRKTPADILHIMTKIAEKMSTYGYVLRSGGAIGADTAFEMGAYQLKEVYYAHQATEMAMTIAAKFHPAWDRCSEYVKKLHGRNAYQILGLNLDAPAEYCICWTPDGCTKHASRTRKTGGTGTAISIADSYGVPIINLAVPEHYETWGLWAAGKGDL